MVCVMQRLNSQEPLQGVKERGGGVGCGVHCKDVCWALIWNVSCGIYVMNVCVCTCAFVCTCV